MGSHTLFTAMLRTVDQLSRHLPQCIGPFLLQVVSQICHIAVHISLAITPNVLDRVEDAGQFITSTP